MKNRFKLLFKSKKVSSSLRLQIGLLYLLLSIINIIYFSVMIFENQMDLLIENFKFQSESTAKQISEELVNINVFDNTESDKENLNAVLKSNGIFNFFLLDSEASVLYRNSNENELLLPKNVKDKLKEMDARSQIVKSTYNIELDSDNFLVKIILPIESKAEKQYYVYSELSIRIILERLNLLYFQIILSICWGIIFHLLFAIYLFKKIFSRLKILSNTSNQMSQGELTARNDWDFSKNDELDQLGISFNEMATNIEKSITEVKKLNKEIQRELEIGKQVQTMFLPNTNLIKIFKPSIYYRPMRQLSGDIYNFFDIDERFKAVFLADATGHGVSAAIVTTVIQMSLNSILTKTKNPKIIMNFLCKELLDVFDSYFMASGVFFLFDGNEKVYIVNSAHNPPLLIRQKDRTVTEIMANGSLLGMDEFTAEDIKYTKIYPGDKFLFYTDGLVEAKNDKNEMYGLEKVKDYLSKNFDLDNKIILDDLVSDFTGFVQEYKDDVTAILIEVPENES
jgi:phosphoserine phosphatase RsbU/P